jgi:hypothetical protein
LLTIYFACFFAGRRELIILEEKNGAEHVATSFSRCVFKKNLPEISQFRVGTSRESFQHNSYGIKIYNTMKLIQLGTRAFTTLVKVFGTLTHPPTHPHPSIHDVKHTLVSLQQIQQLFLLHPNAPSKYVELFQKVRIRFLHNLVLLEKYIRFISNFHQGFEFMIASHWCEFQLSNFTFDCDLSLLSTVTERSSKTLLE